MVTDPLGTAEPDSAGIVVLRSRAVLDEGPGDVWQLTPRLVRVRQPAIDVRRTVVEVARGEVRVTSRFVDLRAVGRTTYDLGLRTPRGLYYLHLVSAADRLAARTTQLVDPSGDEVGCRGVRDDVDRASSTVTFDVPLRCLGRPRWVAVRLLVSLQSGGRTYEENPHNHRPFSEFFTERLYPAS
ncbi:hypothetical protein BH10ACT10_BH10ACT10_15460 [soil metagenome]